jgi:hypothetical protein
VAKLEFVELQDFCLGILDVGAFQHLYVQTPSSFFLLLLFLLGLAQN